MKSQLLKIVSEITKINETSISIESPLAENGLDSLHFILFREQVENHFKVKLSDSVIAGVESLADVLNFLVDGEKVSNPSQSVRIENRKATFQPKPKESHSLKDGCLILDNGLVYADLEIGMPLTGRNNLAEGPLLQFLGDLRWNHMCSMAGVKSRNIVDDQGNRLYPTFFYVDINFPPEYPMAFFGENSRFTILGDLKRFGTSMLDGTFYLFPENVPLDESLLDCSLETAVSRGVAVVGFSNVFVMQFSGAEWLKKSRPSNPGFLSIPVSEEPFPSYDWVKTSEHIDFDLQVPSHYLPLTSTAEKFDYSLVPDRDLNGAGLVYFANYPVFLDICERQYLAGTSGYLFDDELINRRTLVNRKSAYLNNASANDLLEIEIKGFIENPFKLSCKFPELEPIRLMFEYRMFRKSDRRLMMVALAEKTVFGRTAEDLQFFCTMENHS